MSFESERQAIKNVWGKCRHLLGEEFRSTSFAADIVKLIMDLAHHTALAVTELRAEHQKELTALREQNAVVLDALLMRLPEGALRLLEPGERSALDGLYNERLHREVSWLEKRVKLWLGVDGPPSVNEQEQISQNPTQYTPGWPAELTVGPILSPPIRTPLRAAPSPDDAHGFVGHSQGVTMLLGWDDTRTNEIVNSLTGERYPVAELSRRLCVVTLTVWPPARDEEFVVQENAATTSWRERLIRMLAGGG